MNRVHFYLLLSVLKVVAALPFRMLYLLSDFTYYLIRYVLRYRYKVIKGNLERSFPNKNDKEILSIMNAYYHHLADIIFETIKLLHISNKQLEEHILVNGGDMIERIAADGRPIIVFLGHYGNWEWVQEVTRHYQCPAINAEIYRPIHNPVMNELMKRIRARFPTTPIPQKQAIRQLLRMNREGQQFLVGFISDQRPNSKNLYHWTTFLNQDTAYATGGEEIGKHLNAHFVYLQVEKTRRGYYVMTFREMEGGNLTGENQYTRLFLRLMEESICKAPEYWLWSHNRWEFDREGNTIYKK